MTLEEKDRENIALFRYGLIAPLLNNQVSSKKAYLEKIASQVHQVPYWGPKEYTPKAVSEWLRLYRKDGFEALKPKFRSDKGESRRIPGEIQAKILEQRRERQNMPVTLFYEQLVADGMIRQCDFSYATVHRFLKKHGLVGKAARKEPERKRFAHDTVNMLWQTDATSGPYLTVGSKKKATSLIAFIDDCSRVITAARFSFTENTEDLMKVFEEALVRRGIPKLIYADNGKIFRSDQFHLACASLGISLVHAKVGDAQAKGKVERFFGSLKTRFFPRLREQQVEDLDTLNALFWQWLEQDYHRKPHTTLQETPLNVYLSQMHQVQLVEDPASLKHLFLKRDYRKVRHDGTISLHNHLFEVPPAFIGERIEVRYDEALNQVLIFADGKQSAAAKRVHLADNARTKRQKALSFTALNEEDSTDV